MVVWNANIVGEATLKPSQNRSAQRMDWNITWNAHAKMHNEAYIVVFYATRHTQRRKQERHLLTIVLSNHLARGECRLTILWRVSQTEIKLYDVEG